MGSTESTGRSTNGTDHEEEEREQANSGSMGTGTAVAIAAASTVVAAWGISRMISSTSNSEKEEKDDDLMKIKARGTESSSASFRIRESIQLEGKGKGPKSMWSPPPVGRFKMNTDGGCPYPIIEGDGRKRGLAGYAGILRNDRGMWVRGFQGSFDGFTTDSLTAELHGIHKGLKLLDKLKLKGSILESDCQAAVDWVNGKGDNTSKSAIIDGCWGIIEESRQLKLKNNIAVVHVIGENANQCAHNMADIAAKKQGPYLEIRDLPPEITHLVVKDNKSLVNP